VVPEDESRALHARALAGSASLSAEIWERWHDALLAELAARFRGLEPAEVSDTITDVILSYVERPAQYQPDKLPLDRYLRMAAQGDLLNLLDKRRRQPNIIPFEPVAHDRPTRNGMQEAEEREAQRDAVLPAGMAWEAFMRTLRDLFPDPNDREVIELMAEGERDSARFAQVLGCAALAVPEQRRQVKQVKDRIRLRLKRHGIRLHE
jgi:hypothetical protein